MSDDRHPTTSRTAPGPAALAATLPGAVPVDRRGAARGLLAGLVSPDIGPSGPTPRSVGDRPQAITTVADFGAAGDGERDDTASIQRALDVVSARGGGTVVLEPGVYRTSRAIRLRPGVAVTGCGPASVVHNDGSSEKQLERAAFFPGSHHPVAFDRRNPEDSVYDMLPLADVEEGQSILSMRDGGPTPRPVGSTFFAFVRSRGENLRDFGGGAHSIPDSAFVAKVSVRGPSELQLDMPAPFRVRDAHLSPIEKRSAYLGDDWYCLHDASLTNMAVRGEGILHMGCAYRCRFADLTLEEGGMAISLNAMTFTTFERIRASFSSCLFELKSHSHAVRVSEMDGVCRLAGRPFYPISVGEQASWVEFDHCRCSIAREAGLDLAMIYIQGARAITFRHCSFVDHGRGPGPLIGIAGGTSEIQATADILFEGCYMKAPRRHHFIGIGYPPLDVDSSSILLKDNVFDGNTRTGAGILINAAKDVTARGTTIAPGLRALVDEPRRRTVVESETRRGAAPLD